MSKQIALAVTIILLGFSSAFAQVGVNADPDKAKFVTSDIDNFWRAFDLAAKEPDFEKRVEIYRSVYLDKGSTGLKDFIRLRIKDARTLTTTVDNLHRYYGSVRPSTMRIRTMEGSMRRSFRRFKKLYPDAVFPDVYFVVGISNTGGTASDNGLLIGAELYGLTNSTPRDEFVPWLKKTFSQTKDEAELKPIVDRLLATMLKPLSDLSPIVAHESCHFNQQLAEQKTLLAKAIQEGTCDLVAELTAGRTNNVLQKKYGDAHEAELWSEFQKEMNQSDTSRWMYNGLSSKDRPSDLGYYMGYRITSMFYHGSRDKTAALREILTVQDFPSFFQRTGYAESFKAIR
jgi:hypothetical protein